MKMKKSGIISSILLMGAIHSVANASDLDRLTELEQELQAIKERLATNDETVKAKEEAAASKIKVHGAVGFGWSTREFNEGQTDRGGDANFDVLKLQIDGTLDNDITLSADYRIYQYMRTIKHAYMEYPFAEHWRGQLGISQVPFGNLPYNSNNFYFNTTYYAGLEDDNDAGINFIGDYGNHDIRFAYYKNDELGGIDAYLGDSSRDDRYSVDITGKKDPGDGIYDEPGAGNELAEKNTFNFRYAYDFNGTEVGASLMYGGIEGEDGDAGDRSAYALHVKTEIKDVNVMFQYTNYKYDIDDYDSDLISVGYFGFYDSLPTEATLYNLNLAYDWDVNWGPVTNVMLYNDYNLMTNKSGDFDNDTIFNVTGLLFTAGSLYTYVDYAVGQNQPFVGGSLAGDSDETESLVNVNFTLYF